MFTFSDKPPIHPLKNLITTNSLLTASIQFLLPLHSPNFSKLGTSLQSQLNHTPLIRRRLEHIECRNCLFMNFLKLWCPDGKWCASVDPNNNLALFADYHHVSVYGCMFLAEYMRQEYDEWLTNVKKTNGPTMQRRKLEF